MTDPVEFPNKKRMEKTIMDVKEVWHKTEVLESSFRWKIANFNNLKTNVKYWNKSEDPDWTFSITKKIGFYAATISTANYDEVITCFVCYDKGDFSNPIIADRLTGGEHNATFPDKVIDVPQNMFLKENTAEFAFRFNKKTEIKRPIIGSKLLFNSPRPQLRFLRAVFQALNEEPLPDFILYHHITSKWTPAHKAILASRSSYFRKYIQEKCREGARGKMELDTTEDFIDEIIYFMYTGYLVFKPKEIRNQIFALAKKLGVSNAEILCKRHMEYISGIRQK